MPKIGVPLDKLTGLTNPPAGVYEFRLDGFKPKAAKEKQGKDPSVNLQPQLKVINSPTHNDMQIFTFCNTAFGVELYDMCHALGVPFDNDGTDAQQMPGEFQGDDAHPEQWQYIGPLAGATGRLEIGDKVGTDGKTRQNVKKYFCRIPGCTAQHRDSLL